MTFIVSCIIALISTVVILVVALCLVLLTGKILDWLQEKFGY